MRRLLYMAAVSAVRCNPDLAAKYRQLVGRGKSPKVALVAVMRKLVVLADALLRQNRLWAPRTGPEPTAVPPADAAEDAGGPSGLGEGSLGDRSQGPKGHPPATAAPAGWPQAPAAAPLPAPA